MPDVEARWLSVRSAAAYLDCSPRTLYAWALDGTLPGVARIRRRKPAGRGRHVCTVRIDRLALDAFLSRGGRRG